MAEKPILFNTEMVRAIQAGLKTQTRRICKITSDSDTEPYNHSFCEDVEFPARNYKGPCANFVDKSGHYIGAAKQHIQVGDVLWVRETWNGLKLGPRGKKETTYWYRADEDENNLNPDDWWRPSIHMPREAARLFLRVTDVRIERLQHISRDDAVAEGCNAAIPIIEFKGIWNRTVKPDDVWKYGWDADPWVWVIEFERCEHSKEG